MIQSREQIEQRAVKSALPAVGRCQCVGRGHEGGGDREGQGARKHDSFRTVFRGDPRDAGLMQSFWPLGFQASQEEL